MDDQKKEKNPKKIRSILDRFYVLPTGQACVGTFLLSRSTMNGDQRHTRSLDHLGVLDRFVDALEHSNLGCHRTFQIFNGI